MASKTHLLIFLSIAIMATSIADAQILIPINVTLSVSGIVNCTVNSTVGGTARPFPNATVQLQCPPGNNIITTAITNSLGGFNLNVNVSQVPLSILLGCRVVVATPLVNCNASLPTVGRLVGPINIVGSGSTINNGIVIRANVLGLNLDTRIGN